MIGSRRSTQPARHEVFETMHTAPYFTAFGLLTILHAYRIIRLRMQHKVGMGDGGIPELARMVRVFGNHAEYVPLGLVLLIGLEFVQAPVWYMHLCGTTLLVGRILHALGISRTSGKSRERMAGMMLTFFSIFLSSIGVSLWAFLGPSL
jgi:uncharacterized membrane protein YecN with MAPEG domain